MAEGDYLVMLYASGNRDEAAFGPTADQFQATRPIEVPNLAFGFGEHLCLGAALARLEARVVFEELLARFPTTRSPARPSGCRRASSAGPTRCRSSSPDRGRRPAARLLAGAVAGQPDVGVRAGDDALQVAEADAAFGGSSTRTSVWRCWRTRASTSSVGAVREVLALHVQRAAPLAVELVVEAAVEPGSEMEPGVRHRLQPEDALGAVGAACR